MAPSIVEDLRRRFGENLKLDRHARRLYGYDASGGHDMPDAVVYPKDEEDIRFLVALAHERQAVLVPRGSGTGLSGGAIAGAGTISVSFERMRRMRSLDAARRRAWVEPGHVNGLLDPVLLPYGLFFPPDPASHRVSTIGGNIAENAGGPHAVKYGVTGQHVVSLRVVDMAGRTGTLTAGTVQPWADLVSLVVGSEGTLAFVLAAELVLVDRPKDVATMLVSFRDMVEGTDFVSAIVAQGTIPATLEFLDRAHIEAIEAWGVTHYPEGAGAVLLIEYDGREEDVARDVARTERLASERQALGCTTTRDPVEREGLWLGRRGAYAVIARYGRRLLTQDVTVPRQRLTQMLAAVERIAADHGLMVATVGHAGDGNLHPNFPYDPDDAELTRRVHAANDEVMRACVALDGSISGEHGIGEEKLQHMPVMFGPQELGLMAAVRRSLDPELLLNPGKAVADLPRSIPEGEARAVAPPRTAEEVQEAVRDARARRSPLALSLRELRGVRVDLPGLTLEAGAGATLAEVEEALRDSPLELAPTALRSETLCEAVLLGDYGPEHLSSGTWRNHLLAAQYVTGAGELVRFGRPVVKNVAGYDLSRLLIGSRGTLGVPVSFTFRLLPRRAEGWYSRSGISAERLAESVPTDASAAFALTDGGAYALFVRLHDQAAGFEAAPDALQRLAEVRGRLGQSASLLDLSLPEQRLVGALEAAGGPPAVVLPRAGRLIVDVPRARAVEIAQAASGEEGAAVRATYGPRHEELHQARVLEAAWREALEGVFDPDRVLQNWFPGEGS